MSQAVGPPDRPAPDRRPRVAIVTPTKDDPVGIRRTLASVAAQGSTPHEHVVVDGGSDPEVVEHLRAWEAAAPGLRRLVTDPPPGIYPSMNEGIRRTSAPLVLQLPGGDEMTPGTLDRVVAHHEQHGWRWAYGGVSARDVDGRPVGSYTFAPFRMARFRAGLAVIPHPATYVTRQLHDEIGLYRQTAGTGADQEFLLRAAKVSRPGVIPGLLATFWLGGVSGQETLVSRELAWHRNRCSSGTAFGGRPATDAVATLGVIGLHLVQWGVAKVRHDPHPELQRDTVPQPA